MPGTLQARWTYNVPPTATRHSDWVPMTALILACFSFFFFRLGEFGFINPGDGYFSEAAREMVECGDYITPQLNYQIYFSKPILIYWLIASAYHAFGISELSARLWGAALASLLVLVTYWTVRSLSTQRAGLMAGLLLASSPLVVTFARLSMVDMPFATFLGIALCSLIMTIIMGSKRWWPVMYFSLALAVLTKGPAALVLFALALAGYLALKRPSIPALMAMLRSLHPFAGAMIFLVIAVPWYIAVGLATDWLWPKVFFVFENAQRAAGHTNHRHDNVFFYLPVVAYGFFPWVMYLPAALVGVFRCKHLDHESSQANGKLLFFSWLAAVFLTFTLTVTKLQTYVLPLFISLAALVAMHVDRWLTQSQYSLSAPRLYLRLVSTVCLAAAILLALISLAFAVAMLNPQLLMPLNAVLSLNLHALVTGIPLWLKASVTLAIFFLCSGWMLQYFQMKHGAVRKGIMTFIASSLVACALLSPPLFFLADKLREADLRTVLRSIPATASNVAIYQEFKPSVMFYLKRPVDSFFSPDQLLANSGTEMAKPQYIITSRKASVELFSRHGQKLSLVKREGNWQLFVSTACHVQKLPTLERTFKEGLNLSVGNYHWGTLPFAGGTRGLKRQ